jgi:serralysin
MAMKFRFGLHAPLDCSDDGFWFNAPEFYSSPSQITSSQALASPAVAQPPSPVVLPDESIEAQAAVSGAGPGGVGSVVEETSGGLTVNLIFDAAAVAAPASFRAGIEQAAAMLSAAISDKITLNFNIDYSGTGGGAAAGPDNGQWVSYSTVRADLVNNASTGDTTFNALPAGSTIQGQSSVAVWNAQLKLWGLLGSNDSTTDDGSATFATDINPSLLVGVALHELTHAMGRVPYGPQPDIFDFYRYTSAGVRLFSNNIPASAAYFSLNGGTTKLADYGQNSDPSDFLNSGMQGPNDPFNEFYASSTLQQLTTIDLEQLDALGFHLTSNTTTVIEAFGSTSLVQVGYNYFLDPVAGGTGPELKFGGVPLTAGQFGSGWTILGAEAVSGGYDVAWKNTADGLYNIWSVDSNGNYVSDLLGGAAPNSSALESFETIFHQDLNGDGTIGVVTTTIEAFGSTSLVQVASNYFLDPVSGGTGPELKFGGVPLTAGQFGSGWTILGAEAVTGGYDVAWKNTANGLYNIWSVDSNGNYVSDLLGGAAPNSSALESFEIIFHQDLNGDGTIGVVTTTIEAFGSTSLVQVANNYLLDPVAGGTGPELKFGGVPLTAGQFGSGWTILGAEAVSGGYDVAWKNTAGGFYNIWSVDSNGNYVSDLLGGAAPNSAALESFETIFHQDLNGDGTIGPVTTTIEAFGSTSLVQVASNYFLDPVAGGTGPELKFGGVPLTAGQFGSGWTILGAEAVTGGYDVAWKNTANGLYNIWSVDSNGNYVSDLLGGAAPNSAALESFETLFHQDLNGDSVIGVPSATGQSATASASASSAAFDGTVLTLQQPSTFSGQLVGFTRDGTLAGSDQIDLRGVNSSTVYSNFDSSSDTLTISDRSKIASLQFLGQYSQDSFHFADDGNGGVFVIAATPLAQSAGVTQVSNLASHDTFVFAENFGQISLPHFTLAADTLQISRSVFADLTTLLAATHDDANGNAIITDAAHDTITLQGVTTAQLLAHQSDLHIV